jgi:hypothetical protein
MPAAFSPAISQEDHPRSNELHIEQTRDFHFAVTWVTLFAHLDPIEAAGPWHPAAVVQPREMPSTALVLAPVVAPPAPREVLTTKWEMVVPKMVRTEAGNFTPAESGELERQ